MNFEKIFSEMKQIWVTENIVPIERKEELSKELEIFGKKLILQKIRYNL